MNNEQVIKYVSENSKNPHAAMIAEWVLTGCEVEFFDDEYKRWTGSGDNPTWYNDIKYRLVKPKMKPAYRVYIDKDGDVMCARRSADGAISQGFEEARYLTDWIEYEPKQWPTPLVERIAAIDIKAAEWIVDNWDELDNPQYSNYCGYYKFSGKLKSMFSWAVSPQKGEYWYGICKQLGE